ncbi:Uncharacterised protein [Mycobacteroides abscessus subsp. abscessus]|nr:Uncharacterised protein [Mycobacteroides abscessus subsp. abscessus]SHW32944.1 Uncharacterised protein [Mycobacteroides abscessus subsp. abscessus]SIF91685.1 Uncharacterised protein [Mycobacteroides abscessus subsp. abscessus]SKD17756.1 Uncharacterised protein [Mycobacteroides abscessus subsp. abscessus]SKM23101.1 Uncharacterised protein [Mycobacteroides abscessus subsp. abscessus]
MTAGLTRVDRERIEAAVARAPEFTVEQRAQLARLLRPARREAGGGVCTTTRAAS